MSIATTEYIKMIIKPPTLASLEYVFRNMRKRDVLEMEMLGVKSVDGLYRAWLSNGVLGHVVYGDDEPISFMILLKNGPRSADAAMLATDRFNEIGKSYTRYCVSRVKPLLFAKGVNRIECRTWEGHDDSRQWLSWLGAKVEVDLPNYGVSGETFLQYGWNADVYEPK